MENTFFHQVDLFKWLEKTYPKTLFLSSPKSFNILKNAVSSYHLFFLWILQKYREFLPAIVFDFATDVLVILFTFNFMVLKTGKYSKYILDLFHSLIKKEILRSKNTITDVHKVSSFQLYHRTYKLFLLLKNGSTTTEAALCIYFAAPSNQATGQACSLYGRSYRVMLSLERRNDISL